MNESHSLCGSPEWSEHIRDGVIRYMTAHADPGGSMLEIGPGRGAATEWLRHEVKRLVALELDVAAASVVDDICKFNAHEPGRETGPDSCDEHPARAETRSPS